jgi:hypothetical protein
MELDPETMVYKFVPQKALDWLVKKQTAVEHVLVRQVSVKTVESGAFSSDFTLSNDLMTQSNIKKKTTVSRESSQTSDDDKNATAATPTNPMAHTESLQIVCSYLNEPWRKAFLNHLGESMDTCLDASANGKKRRVTVDSRGMTNNDASAMDARVADWNHAMTTGTGDASSSQGAKAAAQARLTVQQKKLSKVNTQGMSKMTSFFTKKK